MNTGRYIFRTALLLQAVLLLALTGCARERSRHPILILATPANFGTYTGEILKAEGFNEFVLDSLHGTGLSRGFLKQFDIVILAETSMSELDRSLLSDYVKQGGNLIAFRPDKLISGIFGMAQTATVVREGYIRIDTMEAAGKGLVNVPVQFHGTSSTYRLKGGKEIASLFLNPFENSGFPAVVLNRYGKGQAAAFSYNLPASIVLTRQGNPAWAGGERDKVDGPTATDLFYPGEGEMQWNDPGKIAIPQADEQMRLLSHIIEEFTASSKPVPRFWYFPGMNKCVFIFTIDGEDSREADIDSEIQDVQSKGGRATIYEIGTYISSETVARWVSGGNEAAVHYNDVPNFADPEYRGMKTVFDTMTANFRKSYGISPLTVRNHWVVWCSKDSLGRNNFAEQAIIEQNCGLGFDCNYYHFGGNKVYPNWIGDVGHFTGSGIPMKFADPSGMILNIYQSNTQLPDETWLKENIEIKSKTLIDRSIDEGYYAYINANFHTWYWSECREAGLKILDYCKAREVPVKTAADVYKFLKMKDEASFTGIRWAHGRLTFRINSSLACDDALSFLIPFRTGQSEISSVSSDGKKLDFHKVEIKGRDYAIVMVTPGTNHDISASYN